MIRELHQTDGNSYIRILDEVCVLSEGMAVNVRDHTATPVIDPATYAYALQVFGSGLRRPEGVTFSLRQLRRMRSREITAFIECAGNGRSFFGSQQGTPVPGSAWTLGAIGVARWRGVPL